MTHVKRTFTASVLSAVLVLAAASAQAQSGNEWPMYGGDYANCRPAGCGAVYSISTNGTYKTLHTFNGSDGVFPSDGLIRLGDKKLVGPVQFGGSRDEGVIFRITP